MRLRVDASSISPDHSAGVEAFTYGLLRGLLDVTAHDIEVEVSRGTGDAWRTRVPNSAVRWSEVNTVLTCDGRFGSHLRRYLPARVGSSVLARRVVNAVRHHARRPAHDDADVTLYPFHCVPAHARPAVVVLHDLRQFQPQFRSPGYMSVIRENVADAAAVVVSWPHPYQQAGEIFPEAREKMVLIPPPTFHARPDQVMRTPEPGLLLYPSSTSAHKNHSTLLDAMAALPPSFRVVCPGPLVEPQATALLSRATRTDIRGRVDFPGFVTVGELQRLYATASAVVVSSTWEAASGAIFEAFSWGLPVVCADVEPLRAQVAYAGGEACFFDAHDPHSLARAVQRMTADHGRYAAASREAGRRLSQRTWADTARDYAAVLDWAADGGRPPIPRSTYAPGMAPANELP